MIFRKKQPIEWIVVFLGNPGQKYENTRHNAGFITASAAENAFRVKLDRVKFKSLTATGRVGAESVLFMKPQTYMNLSGDAVREAASFYKVSSERILVISDDIALPLGKLRVRRSGSAGGHNGLKDIIAKCGGENFPRIKIGVGAPPHPEYQIIDWVLSSFSQKERRDIEDAAKKAVAAIETVITGGIDEAMGEFN